MPRLIDKIVSVAIYEDGNSITETTRSSQLGGALEGGLLAGGVGAVIGGLSGKTETRQTVRDISLRFVLDDTRNPLCDVRPMFQPYERDRVRATWFTLTTCPASSVMPI